jgi:hypothetical protein
MPVLGIWTATARRMPPTDLTRSWGSRRAGGFVTDAAQPISQQTAGNDRRNAETDGNAGRECEERDPHGVFRVQFAVNRAWSAHSTRGLAIRSHLAVSRRSRGRPSAFRDVPLPP